MSIWRIWAYALSLTALWLIVRFSLGYAYAYNYSEAQPKGVLLNLIFVLALMIFTLYTTYSKEPQVRSYFDDFKLCLRAGVAYSVAIGLAIGVYYSTSNDMSIKRAADYAQLEEALNTPEKVAAITSSNEPLKDLTKEEIQQSYIERVNTMTATKTVVAAGMSGMVLSTLIFSLIVPWIFRTVMLKELQ
jgi:cellobiose-specific phosphotransferase system component IIC